MNRRGMQVREQPAGEIGRLLANLRDGGRFQQRSAAHRPKRENYIRCNRVTSNQGSVLVGEKAKPQRVRPRDP